MPAITRVMPELPIRDLDAAVVFFARMGFDVASRFDSEGYLIVERDAVRLGLYVTQDAAPFEWATAYLYVDDVDGLHHEFVAVGVTAPNSAVLLRPWGQREFYIRTPDGVLLKFGNAA